MQWNPYRPIFCSSKIVNSVVNAGLAALSASFIAAIFHWANIGPSFMHTSWGEGAFVLAYTMFTAVMTWHLHDR
jgi:hypothetical protein